MMQNARVFLETCPDGDFGFCVRNSALSGFFSFFPLGALFTLTLGAPKVGLGGNPERVLTLVDAPAVVPSIDSGPSCKLFSLSHLGAPLRLALFAGDGDWGLPRAPQRNEPL